MATELQDLRRCGLPENQSSLSTNGSHEPFHGIHMHFTQAIAIVISSELTPTMVDILMIVPPGLHTSINTVFICVHTCPWNNSLFDQGLDRLLLHIGQEIDDHLTTALHHPKDRWPFLRQGATATFALQSASASFSTLVLHHLWLPLLASNHIGFVTLHLGGERHGRLF